MLGNKIKLEREKINLTQTELGKRIGVGKSTISNYETNYSMPDAETIKKLAEVFNVTTDYLLNAETKINPIVFEIKEEYLILAKEFQDNGVSPYVLKQILYVIMNRGAENESDISETELIQKG